ncbi:MarR family transcriptional regulator [Actinosynnema sp. ALI-1.44]|uniref:MarR family winged helix-turn-helix transcriptional regulator n=1 Tax=Actinosynnema sp. ALI-1.44 TaxID=1933779 RepID=UPI00097BF2CA|nr:MarR family winged helix-turn-helix transcriptional regulator [Actinosynnema sp. ALI-1.44]ONI77880.1 MarR family transcriptional regulator [Actinosynnema sp. ALI-1.44]
MQNEVGGEIADALGVLLRRATRVQLYKTLTADMGEALDELTYPVLSAVARIGPRSAADLASEVGLDRSGVTRRASRLEQAGLLCREPDPLDRRATLLVLTEHGERAVDELRRRLAAHIAASLTTWPPGEAQAFARGLRRFITEGPFA